MPRNETAPSRQFPGQSRVHIGVPVRDVERSIRFYEILLGSAPSLVRPGYARFEVVEPSVNLTLNASRSAEAGRGFHYGIEVKSTAEVDAARRRVEAEGLSTEVEEGVTCCYALQDKFWVRDPEGNQWEVFFVENPVVEEPRAECCEPTCCTGD